MNHQELITELVEYYDCPKELADQAAWYVEVQGTDPAEVVEELIRAGRDA